MFISEKFDFIDEAIRQVQIEVERAIFDKRNPHHKNQYASLESIITALKGPANKHGMSIIQHPELCEGSPTLITRIAHKSGQYMIFKHPLYVPLPDMQKLGAAITYARRYALISIFCIITGDEVEIQDDDDDGNLCSEQVQKEIAQRKAKEEAKAKSNTQQTQKVENQKVSKPQLNAINQLCISKNVPLDDILRDYKVSALDNLSFAQASEIIQTLQ
jgi:hypothetical protein